MLTNQWLERGKRWWMQEKEKRIGEGGDDPVPMLGRCLYQ